MPILQKQQIDDLNAKGEADYASWFLDGFKDWPNPAYRRYSFVPIHYVLSPGGRLLHQQLADIPGELSGHGRRAFRLGLAQAIRDCPRRDEWRETLWQLVHLGVAIRAKEVLEPTMDVLKEVYLVAAPDSSARQAFALVINALANWRGEPELILRWQELLKHPSLHPNDNSILFLALCRAKPEEFHRHLRLAAPNFARAPQTVFFPKNMIKAFAETVEPIVIARHIHGLFSPVYQAPGDNWFLEGLTAHEWSPYWIRDWSDEYLLVPRNAPLADGWPIKMPQPAERMDDLSRRLSIVAWQGARMLTGPIKDGLWEASPSEQSGATFPDQGNRQLVANILTSSANGSNSRRETHAGRQ